ERYRDRLCTFNDDIQGTGAVTLAGLLAAMRVTGERLRDQQVVMLGAGSSAAGISDQIVAAMMSEGASEREALEAIWLVDSRGLVHGGNPELEALKKRHAQPIERIANWKVTNRDRVTFAEVVANVKPTILIGTSAQPRAFTEEVIREIARH